VWSHPDALLTQTGTKQPKGAIVLSSFNMSSTAFASLVKCILHGTVLNVYATGSSLKMEVFV